jgi:hypothetical protein
MKKDATSIANQLGCNPDCVKNHPEILEANLSRFKNNQEDWLTKLNKLKTVTQALVDATDQITSKLNTPDDATKLTAMAQLLKAERLATLMNNANTFTLRASVTANGTTKIKKNLFVDSRVRHTAGADLSYQLFDKDGKLVGGNVTHCYFDYRSAEDVRNGLQPGAELLKCLNPKTH